MGACCAVSTALARRASRNATSHATWPSSNGVPAAQPRIARGSVPSTRAAKSNLAADRHQASAISAPPPRAPTTMNTAGPLATISISDKQGSRCGGMAKTGTGA